MDQAVAELQQRHSRDKTTSAEASRRHLQDLFGVVVACVRDENLEPIIASSQVLAADRFAGGFDIGDVQGEFNVLEEALWREIADTLTGEQRIEALELLNTVLGAGRDALARSYVALAGGSNRQKRAGTDEVELDPVVSEDGPLRIDVVGRVGVITLDDQRRRNAISGELANGIVAALDGLGARDIRAVVLRAAPGMRVWSSGRDISELPRGRR